MFVLRDQTPEIEFGYGIRLSDLGGLDNMNVLFWQSPVGTVSPVHDHPEEQFGYLIKGVFEVTIGDEKKVLKPGDAYHIPSGVSHSFRVIEDTEAVDVFSPRRPVPDPVA